MPRAQNAVLTCHISENKRLASHHDVVPRPGILFRSLNHTYRLRTMYRCRSHEYWLSWLAKAPRVRWYRCHVLATSALVLYLGSAVADGKQAAATMRQVKDSAVSGRSSRTVYLRSTPVVTSL